MELDSWLCQQEARERVAVIGVTLILLYINSYEYNGLVLILSVRNSQFLSFFEHALSKHLVVNIISTMKHVPSYLRNCCYVYSLVF